MTRRRALRRTRPRPSDGPSPPAGRPRLLPSARHGRVSPLIRHTALTMRGTRPRVSLEVDARDHEIRPPRIWTERCADLHHGSVPSLGGRAALPVGVLPGRASPASAAPGLQEGRPSIHGPPWARLMKIPVSLAVQLSLLPSFATWFFHSYCGKRFTLTLHLRPRRVTPLLTCSFCVSFVSPLFGVLLLSPSPARLRREKRRPFRGSSVFHRRGHAGRSCSVRNDRPEAAAIWRQEHVA